MKRTASFGIHPALQSGIRKSRPASPVQNLWMTGPQSSTRKQRPHAELKPALTPAWQPLLLAADAVWARDLRENEAAEMCMIHGQVWITQEGDPQDHVLVPGQQQRFHGPGRLVLQALEGPAEVHIL